MPGRQFKTIAVCLCPFPLVRKTTLKANITNFMPQPGDVWLEFLGEEARVADVAERETGWNVRGPIVQALASHADLWKIRVSFLFYVILFYSSLFIYV